MNKPIDWEQWKAANEKLSAEILKKRDGKFIDVDAIWEAARADLEARNDHLIAGYPGKPIMLNDIIADFYNGAYGPTLMIVTNSKDDLTFLRQLCAELANRDITIKFEELEKIRISGFKTFHLKQIPEDSPSGLRIIDKKLKEPELIWELSALEWLECAELIDGLLLNDSPGHQYLSSSLSDDVLVEVSFKEF